LVLDWTEAYQPVVARGHVGGLLARSRSRSFRWQEIPVQPGMARRRASVVACIAAAAAAAGALGCTRPPEGLDLLRSERSRLAQARPGAEDALVAPADQAKPQRIRGVVRDAIDASPPGRQRFVFDVPRQGRLVIAAGIPGRHHDASAVEFVVHVRDRGRQRILISQLVDPANRAEHRQWVPLEADLARHAGRRVELVLETRGFDKEVVPERAFWGTPTITVKDATPRPLVVVYLVDTLRADHLPLYGYARDTAPELTRFAQDAVVFDQAIASSSWTKPSVASLLTSLPPRDHGCVQFYTPLDPALVTLAERMRDHGYATGAVVVNSLVLARDMHFDQGFSYFAPAPAPQRAGQAVDAALEFLDARRGQPALLYVHTMDAHTPYLPPPPFDRKYQPHPEPGRSASEPSDYKEPIDRDRIVAQYDGAVAYGDQEFGRLLRGLRERGLYDSALVVFLSDHGEEFLDHWGWVHGHTLFDELVRVPLVVKYPGRREAGRRVARQVQLIDVLPTILKSQGIAAPVGIAGEPLEESFEAKGPERVAVLETKYREWVAYGARTSDMKYVRNLHPGRAELVFGLKQDPRESHSHGLNWSPAAAALKQAAEAAVSPAAFRYRLRVDGDASYELRLRSTGWIDVFERVGLDSSERAEVLEDGQLLALSLRPHPGRPREVELLTRPHGVPLWIDGLRNGRRLRPGELRVAAAGVAADTMPFPFPEVELVDGLFSPPPWVARGVSMWLVPGHGRASQAQGIDGQARAELKTLGYLP
jgi:arylsulfatase A-like enzyme